MLAWQELKCTEDVGQLTGRQEVSRIAGATQGFALTHIQVATRMFFVEAWATVEESCQGDPFRILISGKNNMLLNLALTLCASQGKGQQQLKGKGKGSSYGAEQCRVHRLLLQQLGDVYIVEH